MKTNTKDLSLAWQISLMVMLSAVIVMMPDFAFAGTDTPMGNVLCTAVTWFTGNTGKGLATIAITVIGIGALLGKVSWGHDRRYRCRYRVWRSRYCPRHGRRRYRRYR